MQSKIPVYPYNAKTARERGEIEKWRESFRENCACAGGIDILIRENKETLHTISSAMGHSSPDSASIYVKTDIDLLRECSLSLSEVRLWGF